MSHEVAIYTFSFRRWEGYQLNALFVTKKDEWMLCNNSEESCIEIPYVKSLFGVELCFMERNDKKKTDWDQNEVILLNKQGARIIWEQIIGSGFKQVDPLATRSILLKYFITGTKTLRRELL